MLSQAKLLRFHPGSSCTKRCLLSVPRFLSWESWSDVHPSSERVWVIGKKITSIILLFLSLFPPNLEGIFLPFYLALCNLEFDFYCLLSELVDFFFQHEILKPRASCMGDKSSTNELPEYVTRLSFSINYFFFTLLIEKCKCIEKEKWGGGAGL